jgi:hypothetical protein
MESFVTFRDAWEITPALEAKLLSKIGSEVFPEDPLDPAVLKRIVEAAKVSRSFAPHFKKYL